MKTEAAQITRKYDVRASLRYSCIDPIATEPARTIPIKINSKKKKKK